LTQGNPSAYYKGDRFTPWKQIFFKSFPGAYKVDYPAITSRSEEVALRNRILQPNPTPVPGVYRDAFIREMRKLRNNVPHYQPHYKSTVVNHFSGTMKLRYQTAMETLHEEPLHKGDAHINCFLKSEKFSREVLKTKPPRVIQGRHPRYNLVLMTYLRNIEHWFYLKKEVLKGRNLEQRALRIREMLNKYNDPYAYSIDCSKFDSHVHASTLHLEHAIYLKAYYNAPTLRRLLAWQTTNEGKTPSGWSYSTLGRRASGDFNTGLGNTIICWALMKAIIKLFQINGDFVTDGDDLCLITSGPLSDQSKTLMREFYLQNGFEITLDEYESADQLIHCQCGLIETEPPIMVRRPWDVISKSLTSQKYLFDKETARDYLYSVAKCELALNRGVPVLQEFASSILRLFPGRKRLLTDEFAYRSKQASKLTSQTMEITREARLSFENVFNIDIEQQYTLEACMYEDLKELLSEFL
jgi:hypothetical protein